MNSLMNEEYVSIGGYVSIYLSVRHGFLLLPLRGTGVKPQSCEGEGTSLSRHCCGWIRASRIDLPLFGIRISTATVIHPLDHTHNLTHTHPNILKEKEIKII